MKSPWLVAMYVANVNLVIVLNGTIKCRIHGLPTRYLDDVTKVNIFPMQDSDRSDGPQDASALHHLLLDVDAAVGHRGHPLLPPRVAQLKNISVHSEEQATIEILGTKVCSPLISQASWPA